MTALDQAFIKAFARQEPVPLALTPRPLAPAKTSPQEPREVRREESWQKSAPARPQVAAIAEPPASKRQGPEVFDRRSPIAAHAEVRIQEAEVFGLSAPMPSALPVAAPAATPAVAPAVALATAPAPAPAVKIDDLKTRPSQAPKPQPLPVNAHNLLNRPPLAPLSAHSTGAAFQTPSTVRVTRLDEVWAALEKTATLAEDTATAEVEEEEMAEQVVTGPWAMAGEEEERELSGRTPLPIPNVEGKVEKTGAGWQAAEEITTAQWSSTIEPVFAQSAGFCVQASSESQPSSQPQAGESVKEKPEAQKSVAEAPKPSIVLPVAEPEFKPAWQVDHFTWPKLCRRLIAKATDELDRLAEAFVALQRQGQKVLAIGAYQSGEGATTMLLCAAHRLAERGIKTVLVDADLERPRLASRLGVQPQIGWDETTDHEGRSLDKAIIEAMENNLSLLPLCEPSEHSGQVPSDPTRLAACVKTLREHYDMVLVDLGPLQTAGLIEDKWGWLAAGTIDSVVLVQNRRVTSEQQQMALESQLAVAGVAVAGIVENFVADE